MPNVMEAVAEMELSELSRAKLTKDMAPRVAVEALVATGHADDALKLLARLLPKRYAVAWACQCARAEPLSVEGKAGASLAEAWVRDPSEEHRRAAFEFASAGQYRSLGAWLAATAGWASGSLAPAAQQVPVPPSEDLTARATVAAITMLAAQAGENFGERRKAYMDSALALLGGGGTSAAAG